MPTPVKEETIGSSYIKIDDDIYILKKVPTKLKIDEELKLYYETRYSEANTELRTAVIRDTQNEFNEQLNRISRRRAQSNVSIPSTLFNKPVLWDNGSKQLLSVVPIIYNPVQISTSKGLLSDHSIDLEDICDNIPAGVTEETKLTIFIQPHLRSYPMLIGFGDRSENVYTIGVMTFHTMGTMGGPVEMCIGDNKYADIRAMDPRALAKQVSLVNMFSLANNKATNTITGESYRLSDIIREDTVISVVKETGRRANQWIT